MPSLPRVPGRRLRRHPAGAAPGTSAPPFPDGRPAGSTDAALTDAAPTDAAPTPGTTGDESNAVLAELVARVAGDAGDRRRQVTALARALTAGAWDAGRRGGAGARGLGRLLADIVADAAPRIPVRNRDLLRAQHPGRTDDEIADALVRSATRTTASFGAAVGGLAAVELAAPPAYLAAPVQLAAEVLAVAAVEVKLVAELHELHGEQAAGSGAERGTIYLLSWMHQRAVDPLAGRAGLAAVLGYAARRELQVTLMRRLGRNVTKLVPFLAGAVAGAEINRRATRALGEKLAAELRGRRARVIPG